MLLYMFVDLFALDAQSWYFPQNYSLNNQGIYLHPLQNADEWNSKPVTPWSTQSWCRHPDQNLCRSNITCYNEL